MAKYFGLSLLVISLFMVGCGGPEAATEEESKQGMDNMEAFDSGLNPDTGAAPDAGDAPDTGDAAAPEGDAAP